jgi:hypothetical protein
LPGRYQSVFAEWIEQKRVTLLGKNSFAFTCLRRITGALSFLQVVIRKLHGMSCMVLPKCPVYSPCAVYYFFLYCFSSLSCGSIGKSDLWWHLWNLMTSDTPHL